MKYASIKHLACALVAALVFPATALAAAVPVVEWDGSVDAYNFANLTRTVGDNTYTLNLNPVGSANMVAADSSYIQIANADAQCGVTITAQNSNPAVTNGFGTSGTVSVLMKCRDMPVTAGSNRAIISLMDGKKYKYGGTSQQDNGAVLGMYINAGTSGWIWKGSTAGNASLTGDYLNTVSGAFSADEQTVGLTYSYSNGGTAYYVNGSQIQSHSGLRASELAAPYGIALGGVDVSTGSQFYALKNMKIEAIAVFNSTLSAEEVASYKFLSTRSYSGAFPTVSGDFFTSTTVPTWVADATKWNGKLSISDVATANSLDLSLYGNTNSTIELTSIGTTAAWLKTNVTINAKVVLTDNSNIYALAINDGISRENTTFRELAGTGTFSQSKDTIFQGLTINVMTNFTGKLSPNKMPVTFGTTKRIGQKWDDARQGWVTDEDTASKLFIDPDAVLSVPAGFELWSPVAVEFNGTVNFTTDETDYNELVLFRNIGTDVPFGNNAVIKINGEEYDKSLYFIRIKNSNLVLCKRHIFTIHVR